MNFIKRLRQIKPLVFNITNEVVTNYVANGLLAIGASPAMSNAAEEAEDMAKIAQAVALNIGTPTKAQVEAMLVAGKTANESNIPLILDPVAVGATKYRKNIVEQLLNDLSFTVLRGNMAEISVLNEESTSMRGVDSLTEHISYETVKNVAKTYDTIVVATGKKDIISDGEKVYTVDNGHEILTYVTGSGCLLTAIIGAYTSLSDDLLTAVTYAVSMYGVCAERAVQQAQGTGSFKMQFIDELSQIQDHSVKANKKISIVEGD